jgi:methylthioribose-1-phosphate isomerase
MRVQGQHFRTIWEPQNGRGEVNIIDQRHLPHQFIVATLTTVAEAATAIRDMHVRGAGLIGVTAAYGMALAARAAVTEGEAVIREAASTLIATRPTAVNLAWAVERQLAALAGITDPAARMAAAYQTARRLADEDAAWCREIGRHGLGLIRALSERKGGAPVNVLTHCNAGWLAFVDHGSATAPIYAAHDAGVPVHVWVDETRPRSQGAKLTAWELGEHGVPHTLVADNTGGHLMQHGMVDLVIVGSDRTTRTGDVANKIGTYLKALAARDNGVPFYVALPSSSFDWSMRDGIREIPIERREEEEVKFTDGWLDGKPATVLVAPVATPAANFGFDVTPARLVTGLITERGCCAATEAAILGLFPEQAAAADREAAE